MSVDWNKAPDWADRALRRSDRFEWIFGNDEKFQAVGGKIVNYGEGDYYSLDEFEFMEMRPDAWREGEERMNVIPQNGNDGEHYDAVDHPEHYQSEGGIECIDAIRAALGVDGFVAYCRGNAIKYAWRSDKKENNAQDLKKAAWYLTRAAEELEK